MTSASLSSMERMKKMTTNLRTYTEVMKGADVKRRFSVDGSDRAYCNQRQDILLHVSSSVAEELEYARHAIAQGYNPYGSETVADQPHNKLGRKDLKTFEDAFEAAGDRWDYGNKIFNDCLKSVSKEVLPNPQDMRRRPVFSPWEGDEVDRDRLYAGQDFWRGTTKRKLSQSNTVCVIVNCSSPWSRQGEEIMWRGVAGTLITDQLEDSGYRVELWACRAGTDTNYHTDSGEDCDVYTATLVKDSSQPLNWPIMINTMTGWYYRTITWVSFYHKGYTSHCNLGYPVNNLEPWQCSVLLRKEIDLGEANEAEGGLRSQGIVLVEDVWDKEDALKLTRKTLQSFTGEEQYASIL